MDHKVSDRGEMSSSSIYGQEDSTLDIALCIKEEQDEQAYLVPYHNLQGRQSLSGHTGSLFDVKEEEEGTHKNNKDLERFKDVSRTTDITVNIKEQDKANCNRPQGSGHLANIPFSTNVEGAYFKNHQNSEINESLSDTRHDIISIKEEGEAYCNDKQCSKGTKCSTFTTDIPFHIKKEEDKTYFKNCVLSEANKNTDHSTDFTIWSLDEKVYFNRPSCSEETENIKCTTDISFGTKEEECNYLTNYVDIKRNESLGYAPEIKFSLVELEKVSANMDHSDQVSEGREHNRNIFSSINEENQDYVIGLEDWSCIERFNQKTHSPVRIKENGMCFKNCHDSEIINSSNYVTDPLFHVEENNCVIEKKDSEWENSINSITDGVSKFNKRKINDSAVRINQLVGKDLSRKNNTNILQSSKKRKTSVIQNQEHKGVKKVYYEDYIGDSSCLNIHHEFSKINTYCDLYKYENFQENKTITIREITKEQNRKSFFCLECDKRFNEKRLLTRHQKEHTLGRLYQCSECERTFAQKHSLISHYRTHTGEKPYKCTECSKGFSRHANLINHHRTHTGEKPHPCTECEKAFSMKKDLIVHVRTHTGERPFKCTECGKSFGRKDTLCKHERTHTGERPYQCIVCKERFGRLEALRSHEKMRIDFETSSSTGEVHVANKLYQCTECNTSFTQKCNLVVHQRIHNGERPYGCSKCQKRFSHKSCLITHYRTHTGEKPYQCSECHKQFSQKSCLSIHHRTHTGEKPYECSECQKKFSSKTVLFKHYEIHSEKNIPI